MADRTITTGATGETQAPPDECVVQFSANAVEPDVLSTRRAVAEQSDDLRRALSEVGVPDDAVTTTTFRVTQRPPNGGPKTELESDQPYEGTETISVTLHDLDAVGDVLSTAVERAGVEVDTVQFGFETQTKRELERKAIADAATTARKKAEAAAAAEGLAIDGVVSMTTGEQARPRRTSSGLGEATTAQSGSPESGPLDVSVDLEVTYALGDD